MKKILLLLACLFVVSSLSGCASVGYYMQAVQGQMSVMSRAKPIDRWLADPAVDADLKLRLQRAKDIRGYAASELGLPDNGSYKSYADLKRSYVMWNVVATPELSTEPVQWCFPVAGCVDYRGYYSEAAAGKFADGLRQQGYDVRVSGVPAYSTLGWFNDPVLSTFIEYPEAEVARMVFHELAHQVAYAPGDSQFNESFATAVEEVGIERWLASRGDAAVRDRYRQWRERKVDFLALLDRHRQQLEQNFARSAPDAAKRARKAEIFASLVQEYETLKRARWAGYAGYDRWFSDPLSNAHFALMATYHELVPAFHGLHAELNDLPKFYRRVKALAKMDKVQRRTVLETYAVPAYVASQQRKVEGIVQAAAAQ